MSCWHMKLHLKSSGSLGLGKTGEAEGILDKPANTRSRNAWLKGHGTPPRAQTVRKESPSILNTLSASPYSLIIAKLSHSCLIFGCLEFELSPAALDLAIRGIPFGAGLGLPPPAPATGCLSDASRLPARLPPLPAQRNY